MSLSESKLPDIPKELFDHYGEYFCSTSSGLDQLLLRKFSLLFTRKLFSDPNNYSELQDEFRGFKWSENDEEKTLDVELQFSGETRNLTTIYCGVDGLQFNTSGLDNLSQYDKRNVENTHTWLTKCKLTWQIIANEYDEALGLSTILLTALLGLRNPIKQDLGLTAIEPVAAGTPSRFEQGSDESFKVDLVFEVTFNYSVNIAVEGHRLKKIDMQTDGSIC